MNKTYDFHLYRLWESIGRDMRYITTTEDSPIFFKVLKGDFVRSFKSVPESKVLDIYLAVHDYQGRPEGLVKKLIQILS